METGVSLYDNLPASQGLDDKQLAAATSGGDYLGRVQLQISQSKLCKSGEFPINSYAYIKDKDVTDLGKSVDVANLAVRLKAMDMSGDQVISIFDPMLDDKGQPQGEFKRIADKSEIKDSMCLYGPEFLVYIPSHKLFATLFFGSKSARRESKAMNALVNKRVNLSSKHIETSTHDWFAMKVSECNTPFELPPFEDAKKEIEKFLNPPKLEQVEQGDDQAR